MLKAANCKVHAHRNNTLSRMHKNSATNTHRHTQTHVNKYTRTQNKHACADAHGHAHTRTQSSVRLRKHLQSTHPVIHSRLASRKHQTGEKAHVRLIQRAFPLTALACGGVCARTVDARLVERGAWPLRQSQAPDAAACNGPLMPNPIISFGAVRPVGKPPVVALPSLPNLGHSA